MVRIDIEKIDVSLGKIVYLKNETAQSTIQQNITRTDKTSDMFLIIIN